MFSERDHFFMQEALRYAEHAKAINEVPIGAVLVLDDVIVGNGFNQSITTCDPTAHAEIIALRNGAEKIGNYRLVDTTLYVTLEPCLMCAGALVHARIKKLIYGTDDPKAGVISSQLSVLSERFLNHRIDIASGLLKEQCRHLLSTFFSTLREKRTG